jgi:hypothetical protein
LVGLLGVALLAVGYFLPFVIRVDYLAAGPYPACPAQAPVTTAQSLWDMFVDAATNAPSWVGAAEVGIFYALPVLIQIVVALVGLRGTNTRAIFALGLTFATLEVLIILAAANFLLYFRLHFVFLIVRSTAGGCPAQADMRMLGAGFWALLVGFLICVGSNLAQIMWRRA